MRFSILHISDLHRDPSDELDNSWLLQSLEQDVERYSRQDPQITRPALCIVSGDLVYGVKPNATDPSAELDRQFSQAEEFLAGLADRFFDGDRERIIILPGNHEISYVEVMGSVQRIDLPVDPHRRAALVAELFAPGSRLRWAWDELCFYRITDEGRYRPRLRDFART
jgi:3',5'-cyclic AMP phosphodiesterase CpdA